MRVSGYLSIALTVRVYESQASAACNIHAMYVVRTNHTGAQMALVIFLSRFEDESLMVSPFHLQAYSR